jgi:hypothetical protein
MSKKVEKHMKAATAHMLLSWWFALLALVISLIVLTSKTASTTDKISGVSKALLLLGGFYVLHRVLAAAARERREWARKVSIAIACLLLFGFPVGTFFGVYLLINSDWELDLDSESANAETKSIAAALKEK